jgi:hypothetical protein
VHHVITLSTPIPTSTPTPAQAAEGRAERDEIGKKMGDKRDIPPGPASRTINEITHKLEMTMAAATSPNTTVTAGATTVEQHNMKQCNCEKLEAERLENREEGREENQEELRNEEEVKQEATKEVCTQTAGDSVPCHQSTMFDWATNINESPGPVPTLLTTPLLNVPVAPPSRKPISTTPTPVT